MKFFNKINTYKKIFIIISIVILLIPITKINKANISYEERRKLSSYVPLYNTKTKSLNMNYGKDTENWLKDRFLGRIKLIYLSNYLRYFLAGHFAEFNSVIIDKSSNFIYEYIKVNNYSKETQKNVYEQLKIFDEYCKKRDIKFYLVITPQKEMVYKPEIYKTYRIGYVKTNIENINPKNDINVIFPLDNFLKYKRKIPYYLFFKTDTHATLDGSYIIYKALINAIRKDFNDVKVVNITDFKYFFNKKVCVEDHRKFTSGVGCNLAGLSYSHCNIFLDTNYRYYKHKESKLIDKKIIKNNKLNKKTYFYPNGGDLKLLIFGDSFSENLLDIIPYSFKYTNQVRLNKDLNGIPDRKERHKILKYYENEIDNFKPDIIVIILNYRCLDMLETLTLRN